MLNDAINVTPLLKAFEKFEAFWPNQTTEQERAGTVQAFEYCFELAWKMMKRLLAERGIVTHSPKETLRLSVMEGLIDTPEVWFDFLKKRNLTTHTYNELLMNEIIAICPCFSKKMMAFIETIKQRGQ